MFGHVLGSQHLSLTFDKFGDTQKRVGFLYPQLRIGNSRHRQKESLA